MGFTHFVDAKTLATRKGSLMQMIRLSGMPFDTRDADELDAAKRSRQNLLRILADTRVGVWLTIIRREVSAYPPRPKHPGFAHDLDETWERRWKGRSFYTNDHYLTVVRLPSLETSGFSQLFKQLFPRGTEDAAEKAMRRDRDLLENAVAELANGLRRYDPQVMELYRDDRGVVMAPQLSVLGYVVNGEWREIAAPNGSLSESLQWNTLDFTSRERIAVHGHDARRVVNLLGIREYPPGTSAGMLDSVLSTPTEMVVTQSFRFDDRGRAVEEIARQARRYQLVEDPAQSLQAELSTAMDRIASREMAWGRHHLSIAVWQRDIDGLKTATADVLAEVKALSVSMVKEGLGAEPAFWAQLPGNAEYITRAGAISTENFASFASLHAHPRGKFDRNHWGPSICALETTAGTPYYFNFHYGDLGNTVVVGRSGSGKTVLVGFLIAQAQRVPKMRGFVFDKDRANEPTVRALGGSYTQVRSGEPTGWNPFAMPDTPQNRAFLKDLMQVMVTADGRPISARDANDLSYAVDETFRLIPERRRLREVCAYLPHSTDESQSLYARMEPWFGEGPRAWLFDNPTDTLEFDTELCGFDMTTILAEPVLSQPTLAYLFHRVTSALTGDPTIVYVDEGWHFLAHPVFEQQISGWLRTIRKKNGIFVLITQSAADALASAVGKILIEQCVTQVFFPVRSANRTDYVSGWSLTDREFDTLLELGDDSRAFLVRRPDGSVLVKLDLSDMPEDLAVLSARASSLELLDKVRLECGDAYDDWKEAFRKGATQ